MFLSAISDSLFSTFVINNNGPFPIGAKSLEFSLSLLWRREKTF